MNIPETCNNTIKNPDESINKLDDELYELYPCDGKIFK